MEARWAGAVVLALLLVAWLPTVSGQLVEDETVVLNVQAERGGLLVPLNGEDATDIRISLDTHQTFENASTTATVRIDVSLRTRTGEPPIGWSASVSPPSLSMRTGEAETVTLRSSAVFSARPNIVLIDVNVSTESGNVAQEARQQSLTIVSQADQTHAATVFFSQAPPRVGPYDIITEDFRILNSGNYPDNFQIRVTRTGPLTVTTPGVVGIGPREEVTLPMTIMGPQEYFLPQEQIQSMRIEVSSLDQPEQTFTRNVVAYIQGYYMPVWTFPFWVVLVALAAYGGQRTYEKVKRDRRRYGHPAPKYTEEQKEKLEQLKERDKEKYKAVKERLDQRYDEQLEAYKERKRKGKARQTGALLKKLDRKRKQKEKLRRSGLKTVKKLKKKGASPDEIYEALEPGEREQLQDSLPEILTAATAAGALVAAADDDEEMGTVDRMRAKKAETEEKRLRAEALMLIEHRREEGYDPEEIREELSEPQKLALGDDLEFALEGET